MWELDSGRDLRPWTHEALDSLARSFETEGSRVHMSASTAVAKTLKDLAEE